jgi:hypothetical protein
MIRRVLVAATAIFALAGVTMALAALPPGGSFNDDDGNIHEPSIEAIAAEGITRGCNPPANDLYCPSATVTRGQMAAFLVRALALIDDGGGNSFTDDDGSVFESDIAKLAAAGITKGCNPPVNDLYCPYAAVTRGQMAAFLVRAMGYVDYGDGDLFIDDNGSVFEADIDKLGTAGVTKGCNPTTNDRYCPDDPVKRDQMASFLTRALSLTPIVPPPPTSTTVLPTYGCASVSIIEVKANAAGFDMANPNGEWVIMRNDGVAASDMSGCVLHDDDGNRYTFTDFSLVSGGEVQLFSGCGTDSATELYWCAGALWRTTEETATLRNVDNSIVDTFSW